MNLERHLYAQARQQGARAAYPEATSRASLILLMLTLTASQAGCAWAPPKPWEKDLLARPAMTLEADSLERRFTQHIYTSKENSSGGEGVGGGGCGCN